MTKKTMFLLLVFFAFTKIFSQEMNLQTVLESLAKHKNTVGNFTQIKTSKKTGKKLESSGKFIISNYGILWDTKLPFASSLALGENYMIQSFPNGKKTSFDMKNNKVFASISNSLKSIFSNDISALKENFNLSFTNDEANCWKLYLQPKDQNVSKVLESILLSGKMNDAKVVLSSMCIDEKTGNETIYTFSEQTYPKELTENEKSFFENN